MGPIFLMQYSCFLLHSLHQKFVGDEPKLYMIKEFAAIKKNLGASVLHKDCEMLSSFLYCFR